MTTAINTDPHLTCPAGTSEMTGMTPTSAVPHCTEFTTGDPAELQQYFDDAYGARLQLGSTCDSSHSFKVSRAEAGQFTTARVLLPADLTFRVDGRDEFVVTTVHGGAVAHHSAGETSHHQTGDVYLSAFPSAHFTSRACQVRTQAVTLPAPLLRAAASIAPDKSGTPLEFHRMQPVPGGAGQWQRAARFVEELLRECPAANPPGQLVLGQAARLLAATLLSVFPNTVIAGPTRTDRRDAHPATVGRAVEFIEAHSGADITLADIAAAASVTPRAVQLAFRRHLDTTPTAYLRRVRLEQAHLELLTADPGYVTVTAVAYRWGFASPSRFAADYRRAYGHQPFRTLHHG